MPSPSPLSSVLIPRPPFAPKAALSLARPPEAAARASVDGVEARPPHTPQSRAAALGKIVPPARPGLAPDWAQRSGFTEYHFTATNGETFADVTRQLDGLKARGVGAVLLYAPYRGDPEAWLGAVAYDFYEPFPGAGSLDDFRALVNEAHARGIAVVFYMGTQSIHGDSTLFKQAEQDKAQGRETYATRNFLWTKSKADAKRLGVPQSGWKYSATAKAYYATSWGFPALNYRNREAVDELAKVIGHWGTLGVDGYMFDAPDTAIGLSKPDEKFLLGDLPAAWGATYRFPEGQAPWALKDWAKSNVNFGIFGDDVDDASVVEDITAGRKSADDLERMLAEQRDWAVRNGGGVARPWVFSQREAGHLLNGAVLAGSGVRVELFHSINGEADSEMTRWPAGRRERVAQLTRALASNPAQAPGGGRQRLATGKDRQHYAVKRTSRDGTRAALNVYNFKETASDVTVDLRGSGLTVGQRPRDAFTGQLLPPVTSDRYTVKLPAQGFVLLDVAAP